MSVTAFQVITIAVLAYLVGGFDAGYYLVRARTGADLREIGSGGTGARNAGRVLGRSGFLLVFAADALKGLIAVQTAAVLGFGHAGMSIAMLAVIIGHVLPLQLGFRGGKGASAACGAMLAFAPLAALATIAVLLALVVATRRQVASGVASFFVMPLIATLVGVQPPDVLTIALVAALLVTTHRHTLPQLFALTRRAPASLDEVPK